MFTAIFLLIIFAACFASLYTGGLWSNALTLINVVTAALVATNYFEPLADLFDRNEPSGHYLWDFVAIWFIFGIVMIVLRAATDFASKVKVKFFMPVDRVGGLLMATWVSWVVVCFATMTLHTAPLARNALGGSFQPEPDSKMFFGLAPDRMWLGWVQRESRGALCRFGNEAPFDPYGEFILRYGNRRAEFEGQLSFLRSKENEAPAIPNFPLPQ